MGSGRRFRSALMCLVCAALTAAPAAAEEIWGQVLLPGGTTAGRQVLALGDQKGRMDASWLLDFVRRYYTNTNVADVTDPVETLERYTTFCARVRTAFSTRWKDGFTLEDLKTKEKEKRTATHDFAEELGLRVRQSHSAFSVEQGADKTQKEKLGWLAATGVDVATLVTRLNAGERVQITIPMSSVPLPLPGFWQREFGPAREITIAQIVRRPENALLYSGLIALDDQTLTYLATHPAFLVKIRDDVAAPFAAFSRSIRVRSSHIETPGGAAAVPWWEALVGRKVTDPERFVRSLLEADNGRLAWFYDVVEHLDQGRQAFVLGSHTRGQEQLKTVYRWFAEVEPSWRISVRPLFRPAFDPSLVLASLDVDASGAAGPTWWPALLEKVSDSGWPDNPDRVVRDLRERPADAAWVLAWIFDKPQQAFDRFRMLRFAQRRLAGVPKAEAPRAAIILHAFLEMPALCLALERMGLRTPEAFAQIASVAHRFNNAGQDAGVDRLSRWQAGLAIIEQVQRVRAWPEPELRRHLDTFLKATSGDPQKTRGEIAAWLAESFLPAVGCAADPAAADGEANIITALGGGAAPTAPMPPAVTWEGLTYAVNWDNLRVHDAIAIDAVNPGPNLTTLVALTRARRQIEKGLTRVDEAHQLASALLALSPRLSRIPGPKNSPPSVVEDVRSDLVKLSKVKQPRDLRKMSRLQADLLELIDSATSVALPAAIYALAVSPTTQMPVVYGSLSGRHVLAPTNDRAANMPQDLSALPPWQITAWRVPELHVGRQGGSFVVGALLAVDVALADSQLRRAADSGLTSTPTITDADAASLAQRLALRPVALTDETHAAIRTALKAGRSRLQVWQQQASQANEWREEVRASMQRAAIHESRISLFLWSAARNAPDAANALTMTDVYRLGTTVPVPAPIGVVGIAADGCLCLSSPAAQPAEDLGGRHGRGLVGAGATDLSLRMIEAADDLKLPRVLIPLLLGGATQDLIIDSHQWSADDWEALAAWTRALPGTRVEDYVLALIAGHVLVPPAPSEAVPQLR
jgi:hypothetical protein